MRDNPWRFAVVCLLVIALAGCAAGPADPRAVLIAPGVTMTLPAPGALGRTLDAVQMVTAVRGADSFVFEGRLSVRPDSLLIVGSDSMGRRAMTIRWAGGKIAVERASWLPSGLRPENVLADIMLIYWPTEAIVRALGPEIRVEDLGSERRISRNGQALITIRYEGVPHEGTATLTNLLWDYRIEVRSIMLSS